MAKVKNSAVDKVEALLDNLQNMMENQEHIKNPYKVLNHISSINNYWSFLNDEEKDFVDNANYFTEGKLEWV